MKLPESWVTEMDFFILKLRVIGLQIMKFTGLPFVPRFSNRVLFLAAFKIQIIISERPETAGHFIRPFCFPVSLYERVSFILTHNYFYKVFLSFQLPFLIFVLFSICVNVFLLIYQSQLQQRFIFDTNFHFWRSSLKFTPSWTAAEGRLCCAPEVRCEVEVELVYSGRENSKCFDESEVIWGNVFPSLRRTGQLDLIRQGVRSRACVPGSNLKCMISP